MALATSDFSRSGPSPALPLTPSHWNEILRKLQVSPPPSPPIFPISLRFFLLLSRDKVILALPSPGWFQFMFVVVYEIFFPPPPPPELFAWVSLLSDLHTGLFLWAGFTQMCSSLMLQVGRVLVPRRCCIFLLGVFFPSTSVNCFGFLLIFLLLSL